MESGRTAIDTNELWDALEGKPIRGNLEDLAGDLEAKAVQLMIRTRLEEMQGETVDALGQVQLQEVLDAQPEEEDRGAAMKTEEVVEGLQQEQSGKLPPDPETLAQALRAKARILRQRAKEIEREMRQTNAPAEGGGAGGPGGGPVERERGEMNGRFAEVFRGPSKGEAARAQAAPVAALAA
ncbi:MAG: hypothetical protein PHI23_02300 [Candidatus Peribacteraceae bacterium]|nr:hypothetical protein [Candidatus Peribacteraceae bacterium]